MKITHTEIFKADLPLLEPFRIAYMETVVSENVYIRIHTDGGIHGLGESSPADRICGETQATNLAFAQTLASMLKGRDPLEYEARIDEIDRSIRHNTQIRAAFDMALYDIAAKAAGAPLYRFLGGERRKLSTDLTVPIQSPEAMAAKAKQIVAMGFDTIKVKLGVTAEEDIERVRAIRGAVGPGIGLRLDANQGWDPADAIRVLTAVAPLEIECCEQPVPYWDYAGMAYVRSRVSIPIMADESVFDHHDALRLASGECCDYLNIKLAKSAGIRGGARVAAIASASGKACMVGSMMESRLGLAAGVHFACAHKIVRFLDLDTALLLAQDPIQGGYTYDGGAIQVGEEPGLGVEIDPAWAAKWECVTV